MCKSAKIYRKSNAFHVDYQTFAVATKQFYEYFITVYPLHLSFVHLLVVLLFHSKDI